MRSKINNQIARQLVKIGKGPIRAFKTMNDHLEFGEWLNSNKSEFRFESRYEMYRYLNDTFGTPSPIHYLEFGVYQGNSIRFWASLNQNRESRFVGFDTFTGLPEIWGGMKKGAFDVGGEIPSVDDFRIEFVKGYFQKTLPVFLTNFKTEHPLIIHYDADLYTSTLFVLTSLSRWQVPGTILIFDEFSSVSHEFRAFIDYAKSYMINYKIIACCGPLCTQIAIQIMSINQHGL